MLNGFSRPCREGSARGFGIRVAQLSRVSDSWIVDPISRHIVGLRVLKEEEEEEEFLLWPLVLHVKGSYCILALPLVEPRQFKEYESKSGRPWCGDSDGEEDSLSSLLLSLPCITGYGEFLAMCLELDYCQFTAGVSCVNIQYISRE